MVLESSPTLSGPPLSGCWILAINDDSIINKYLNGDIHEIKDKKIHIKKSVIIKVFNGKYILVGYPDYHKMVSHLAKNSSQELILQKLLQSCIQMVK